MFEINDGILTEENNYTNILFGVKIVKFKYALIDGDSERVIGYCVDIQGISFDEEGLLQECVTEGFLACESDLSKNEPVHNVFLAVVNDQKNILGGYYCFLAKPFSVQVPDHFILHFRSEDGPTLRELQLWEYFRIGNLNKGSWCEFDYQEKIEWLHLVRKHAALRARVDVSQGVYTINCKHIIDKASFYIELGEAINGTGGYYGSCLDSLEDCLCGGFGALPPYKLVWDGFDQLMECSKDQRSSPEDGNPMTLQAYIQEAMKLLEKYGVSNEKV